MIPKSVSKKRIISNSKVFDFALSDEEMREVRHLCLLEQQYEGLLLTEQLDDLDEYLVTDWDVVDCP